MSLSDLSSTAKMSVVGGRERLALLCLAGVKGGSGLEFQLNTSYMDEDILISANKPFNATQILGVSRKNFLNGAGVSDEKNRMGKHELSA